MNTAKEELKLATIQAQRYQYFARVGAGSNLEAEERLAAVAAQSHLVATQKLRKTAVHSPINGVVGHLENIKPGKYCRKAMELLHCKQRELSIDLSIPAISEADRLNQK